MRLDNNSIKDILILLHEYNPYISESILSEYCNNSNPINPSVHIYGYYADNILVSVMTATYMFVMPHKDSPSGRIVQISGAYTNPNYRHQHIASKLLKEIQEDALQHFHADYICCDSSVDNLYISNGFKKSEESRLWKII